MDANKKRKYLLYSKDDGRPDHEKPCAFFSSPEGCRNGANCRFSHGIVKAAPAPAPAPAAVVQPPQHYERSSVPAPVVKEVKKHSSISQAPVPVAPASIAAPAPVSAKKEKKEKSRKSIEPQTQSLEPPRPREIPATPSTLSYPVTPFQPAKKAAPAPAPVPVPQALPVAKVQHHQSYHAQPTAAPVATNKKPRLSLDNDEEDGKFLVDAVNFALKDGENMIGHPSYSPPGKGYEFASQNVSSYPTSNPFVANHGVYNMLSTSGTDHATKGPERHRSKAAAAPAPQPAAMPSNNHAQVYLQAPAVQQVQHQHQHHHHSTPAPVAPAQPVVGGWEGLVQRTQAHPRFAKDYSFDMDSTWLKSKVVDTPYTVIAMDCEMCQTLDPVTDTYDQNALVRFSVINGAAPNEVIIDTLVNPGLPISDMRTSIHNISEESLTSVTFTRRHAQAFLKNNCSENTIVVGHGLHNDLKSLRFAHVRVVDTAYLYTLEGDSNQQMSPSLREVSEIVLGNKQLELHDSVHDARAALQAAIHYMTHGPSAPIARAGTATSNSLLVHRIPDSFKEEHIVQFFLVNTSINPIKVNPITGNQGQPAGSANGKTLVYFNSKLHADLAFDSIAGPNRPDKSNKPQKRAYIKTGGYICIRKNSADDSIATSD